MVKDIDGSRLSLTPFTFLARHVAFMPVEKLHLYVGPSVEGQIDAFLRSDEANGYFKRRNRWSRRKHPEGPEFLGYDFCFSNRHTAFAFKMKFC